MADSSRYSFEKLKSGGWFNWSMRMQMRLVEKDLWGIISGAEERPETGVKKQATYDKRAQTCLAELVRHVEDSELPHIRRYLTPPEPWLAWERLREIHEGRGWATRIQLRRKFITAQMDVTKPMQDHINMVNELATRLASIGSPVSEEDILLVLLASLPDAYDNIVVALETHHTSLTVDIVTSALLNEERRQADHTERLYPNQVALVARKSAAPRDKSHITCFHCGRKGHYKSECPDVEEDLKSFARAKLAAVNQEEEDSKPFRVF